MDVSQRLGLAVGPAQQAKGLTGPGIRAITPALRQVGPNGTLTGVGFTASRSAEQPIFWQAPVR